ncbi:neurotactin-like [Ischnura elegans]|uniref:neurotactin-like n=1 Tax=Ischnura elegans TaxID=197161 RepID=UPI001ED8B6D5|nr:neurotactin-like [Ischnura elegans]XP_046394589.1 neurotactin-like [Ischnura elegans]
METVKLESDVEKQDGDKESRKSLKEATGEWGKYEWRHRMITHVSKRRFIILCGLVLFVLLLIVIISIAASSGGGPHDHRGGASGDILHVEGRHVTAITSCGPVQGWLEDGAFAFRGIPYALPPVAALRWKPPVPLQRLEHCWNGTLVTHNATSPQPHACWQTFMNGSLDGYEDCLTVDVFAPRTKRNAPRVPVVVLIAAETLGGGGGKGSISPQLLSPQLARAAGVILVRVRFRLGALGFLSARALTQASSPPHSGNYGLADVRAALRWVNLNALAFGGDPRSITVLGHRAGATLVMALATSRKAHRLFSRAWLSGPASAFPPGGEAGQLDAEKRGQALVEALKCDNDSLADEGGSIASCLYQYDAEELLDNVPEEWKWRAVDLPSREEESDSLHRWLIVDGDVLNEPPLEAWASHSLEVPLVIGTLSHGESTRELRRRKDWSDLITVKQHIEESAVGKAKLTSEAMKLYSSPTFPPSSGSAPPDSPPPLARLTAMITDIRSICPLLNFTRSAAALANNVPLYFYTAASLPEESGAVGAVPESPNEPDMASALIGPGADLQAILTQPLHDNGGGLAKAISHMFYTYVRHGPTFNTTGSEMEELGAWPESKMPHRLMLIGQDGKVESVADYPRCEFWTKNGFVPRYARLD